MCALCVASERESQPHSRGLRPRGHSRTNSVALSVTVSLTQVAATSRRGLTVCVSGLNPASTGLCIAIIARRPKLEPELRTDQHARVRTRAVLWTRPCKRLNTHSAIARIWQHRHKLRTMNSAACACQPEAFRCVREFVMRLILLPPTATVVCLEACKQRPCCID
jgi:hypothetical protein